MASTMPLVGRSQDQDNTSNQLRSSKVESRLSEKSGTDCEPNNQAPEPTQPALLHVRRPVRAWLQVVASFCIFFNTWGLLNAYGVFQSFYQQRFLETTSASDISWIGTLQSSFIMLGSVYAGPLYDWGYLRPLIAAGSFMIVFGMFMTSLCTKYWQIILSQGLLMGLGTGCVFTPTVGILATYFPNRKGIAIGIANSGSALGGIIYPIVFTNLITHLRFGWTTRVLAFIALGLLIIPVFVMKMKTKPAAIRRVFDIEAWRDPEFPLYAASLFVGYAGMFVPYFYIQLYASQKHVVDDNLNSYLLPIINAASFFGRLAFGGLADAIGPMNAFVLASGACGILLFGWIGIVSKAGVLIFCILYGFFAAGLITLPAAVVAISLCPDMRQFGVRITMQLVPSAIGLLIGNPIAGAALDQDWLALQLFSSVTVIASCILAASARVAKVGVGLASKC